MSIVLTTTLEHFILIGTKKDDSTCGSDFDYTSVTPNKDIEAGITDFNL